MPARVLVVDDDGDLLEVVSTGLSRAGFETITHGTVPAARRALSSEHFDAVITDLGLSDTGGLALCEELKREKPELPVIVMTGHADADPAARALGATEVLIKPVELPNLVAVLQRLLDKK